MLRPEVNAAAESALTDAFRDQLYGSVRPGTAPVSHHIPLSGGDSAKLALMRSKQQQQQPYEGGSRATNTALSSSATQLQQRSASAASTRPPVYGASTSTAPSTRPSSALELLRLHGSSASLGSSTTTTAFAMRKSLPVNHSRNAFAESEKFHHLMGQVKHGSLLKQASVEGNTPWVAAKPSAQELFERSALQALDDMLYMRVGDEAAAASPQTAQTDPNATTIISDQLAAVHNTVLQTLSHSLGGDGVVAEDPDGRLQHFRMQLLAQVAPFPGLKQFTQMIFKEHDRCRSHDKRAQVVSESALLKDTLHSTVQELAMVKRQYLDSVRQVTEQNNLIVVLKETNEKVIVQQKQLEAYVDELRVTLSSFTNQNIRGAPQMRPDVSSKSGFVESIRRLAKEVESLRTENIALSDAASQHVAVQEVQAAELRVALERATEYQKQVGHLKGALRAMKGYVEMLEARVRELRNVHEENEMLRTSVPMQVANFEREYLLPLELLVPLAQHQFLQQKSITFVAPAEYADGPTAPGVTMPDEKLLQLVAHRVPARVTVQHHGTEEMYEEAEDDFVDSADLPSGEGSQAGREEGGSATKSASSGRSLAPSSIAPSEFMMPTTVPLPLHLASRFGNLKLKPMTVIDVKTAITELFTDFRNALEKRASKDNFSIPVSFEQFAKDWAHRRLKGERVSFEFNMSLFYWSDVYRYKAPEMAMYYKASLGQLPGTIWDVAVESVQAFKAKLVDVEPTSKKQKDRIPREVFMTMVRQHWPSLKPVQLEAICATSVHAQEGRISEDVMYETFFDRTHSGGSLMYDALLRAAMCQCESLFLRVEEALYRSLHERNEELFNKLKQQRDENGSSGTVGAEPVHVESAMVEKCGHCPIRVVVEAIREVDPHCPFASIATAIAIAANRPDFTRLVEGSTYEEEAMETVYEVSTLVSNLRKGFCFSTITPAPAPVHRTSTSAAASPSASVSAKRTSVVSPPTQDLSNSVSVPAGKSDRASRATASFAPLPT